MIKDISCIYNICKKLLMLFSVTVIFTGCNDQVFVERVSNNISDFTLSAGQTREIEFATDELMLVGIVLPIVDFPDLAENIYFFDDKLKYPYPVFTDEDVMDFKVKFYDRDGELIKEERADYNNVLTLYSDASSSVIPSSAEIVNTFVKFRIDRTGVNKISVTCIENIGVKDYVPEILLCYSYKNEYVGITMPSLSGDNEYQVVSLDYPKDFYRLTEYADQTFDFNLDNNTSQTAKYEYPIADKCKMITDFTVNPFMGIKFCADSVFPEVEVPTYHYGESGGVITGMLNGHMVKFGLGEIQEPGLDAVFDKELQKLGYTFGRVYNISLPPMTGVKATFTVSRVTTKCIADLRLRNTKSGYEISVPLMVKVDQPYWYSISYDKYELNESR